MAGDYDYAVFGAGKLRDDVSRRELAFGSIRGECILFDCVSLEMGEDEVFDLLVICAPDGSRAEGHDLFHVLHGAGGIDCGQRATVGGK